jgi:hypothetical protein
MPSSPDKQRAAMKDHDITSDPERLELDPTQIKDTTEPGELERPQLLRKIDCAENPEVNDRQRSLRRRALGRGGR